MNQLLLWLHLLKIKIDNTRKEGIYRRRNAEKMKSNEGKKNQRKMQMLK